MRRISTLALISLILVIIGGINWLLVGLFGFDLVAAIFAAGWGTTSVLSSIIYILVGLAAIYLIFWLASSRTETT